MAFNRYRFTLHQVYGHYALEGSLNWRETAAAAGVSTRTLRNYFHNVEDLEIALVDYHKQYLENYYTKFRIDASKYEKFPIRLLYSIMLKHKICYLFTDKAFKKDLLGKGSEIYHYHLDLIKKAMIQSGADIDPDKIDPELTFKQLILPLEESKTSEEFFEHMMGYYFKKSS